MKKKLILLISLSFLLIACNNKQQDGEPEKEHSVYINNKSIEKIIMDSIENDNDNELIGTWTNKNGAGFWSFYNDNTILVFGNLENVGIHVTAGTYKLIGDNKLVLTQNIWQIGKGKNMKVFVSEYDYVLEGARLEITSDDFQQPMVLERMKKQ